MMLACRDVGVARGRNEGVSKERGRDRGLQFI